MCIESLVGLADDGAAAGPLVDLGTGSGVLAICAAKLGWRPVRALDHEPASLQAAAENAAENGVELELGRVNLRQELPALAPTVVANLTAPLLRRIAAGLQDAEEHRLHLGLCPLPKCGQKRHAQPRARLGFDHARHRRRWAASAGIEARNEMGDAHRSILSSGWGHIVAEAPSQRAEELLLDRCPRFDLVRAMLNDRAW